MRRLDDWLKAYLVYTNESESPDEYHLWSGISNISAVLRRRVWFDMRYFALYPNMYIVLVSPPGRCKKSTAMRIARSVLKPVPGIELSSDSTTRERLIQDLATSYKDGYSAMTAHSSEFGTMLTSSGMDMVVFMTDIFDCPIDWSHRTKISGINEIKAPFLNLLAGTTPDWMSKAMPLDTVGIGLTSRISFVYQDTPRIRGWRPELSPAQKDLAQILTEDLAHIATLSGEYSFEPDADAMFDQWYRHQIANPNVTGDPRLNGYYERKPMHLIKVAMIISASRRDELVITSADLTLAMEFYANIESRMHKVFAGVGRNPLNMDTEDLLARLLSNPSGVSKEEIVSSMRYSLRLEEINEVLDTLTIAGKIILRGGRYYLLTAPTESSLTD